MKITPRGLIPILVALSLLFGGRTVFAHTISGHDHIHLSGHEDRPGRECGVHPDTLDKIKCDVLFSGWTTSGEIDPLTWWDESTSDGGSWSITLDFTGGTGICDRSWIIDGTWRVNKGGERLKGDIEAQWIDETETETVYSWVIWPEGHGSEGCDVSNGDFPYGGDPNHAGYTHNKFDIDINCDTVTGDACWSPLPYHDHEVAKFLLLLDNGYTIQGCLDDMHLPDNPFEILRNPPKVWGCVTIPDSGGTGGEDPPAECSAPLLPKGDECGLDDECCSGKCKGKPGGVKICR